jgi:hypothetical protein
MSRKRKEKLWEEQHVRFKVLTAVVMKCYIFWDESRPTFSLFATYLTLVFPLAYS